MSESKTIYTGYEPLVVTYGQEAILELVGSDPADRMKPGKRNKRHDEAMRMQALRFAAAMAAPLEFDAHDGGPEPFIKIWARWAYREATGHEW